MAPWARGGKNYQIVLEKNQTWGAGQTDMEDAGAEAIDRIVHDSARSQDSQRELNQRGSLRNIERDPIYIPSSPARSTAGDPAVTDRDDLHEAWNMWNTPMLNHLPQSGEPCSQSDDEQTRLSQILADLGE